MTCKPLGCCNFFAAPPAATTSVTAEYAGVHDSAVLSTFADFLGVDGLPDLARRIAPLPLSLGGLGRIACLSSVSTCRLRRKLSSVTLGLRLRTCRVFALLPQHAPSSAWRIGLPRAGAVCRPCRKTGPPPSFADGKGPRHQLLRRQCEQLLFTLDRSSEALLRSQQGPFASRFLTTVPTCPTPAYPSHLRLPLPLSQRYCRCCRPLASLGSGRCPPEPRVPSRAGRRARPGRG